MRTSTTRSTAAVALAIVALLSADSWNGSADSTGAARAKGARKGERVPAHTCSEKLVMTCNGKEVGFLASSGFKYVSPEYGWRQDIYNQFGQLLHQTYALRPEQVSVTVVPVLKQYRFRTLTEKEFNWLEMDRDAMIQQFTSGPHTQLGRRAIGGIEAEGIEIQGGAKTTDMLKAVGLPIEVDIISIRLWTNRETSLPVEVQFRAVIRDQYVTVWTGGKPVEVEVVDHDFRWHDELDRSVFEPNVADDYTLLPEESDRLDQETAIAGLRTFAQLTEGTYPSKLNMLVVLRKACQASQLYGDSASEQELKEREDKVKQIVFGVKPTCLFLCQLAREGKDAAYYGDAVTATDVDSVLLRWRARDDEYVVVFGDLTVESMPAEQLAELVGVSCEAW